MIVWQTTKKCILHYSMRSLTHWSKSNSRILAAQKTFSSPPSSKLRKSISPQKTKPVPFPSHARHGVRAVAADNETQKIHGEAMYTATDSAGGAALRAKNCQCAGSRGKAPRLSLGGFKGGYSLRKESIPLCPAVALSAALSIQRSALQPPIPRKGGNQKGYPLRKESIPL